MNFNTELFGRTTEGEEVSLYTLTSAKGLRARITNYGAILVSLEVPDRHGKLDDITLGFESLDKRLCYLEKIIPETLTRFEKAHRHLIKRIRQFPDLAAGSHDNPVIQIVLGQLPRTLRKSSHRI